MRDLEEACAIDTYSPEGVLVAQELRSPDRVQRFDAGQLVEEIELDAAGRVVRRSSSDRTEVWAFREDGAVIDHRWGSTELEEREVLSCDGRIDQLVTSQCDVSPRQYHYDSTGRLVRINQTSNRWSAIEELVYDERNRLRVHRNSFGDMRFWDADGRLIRNDFGASSSTTGTEHHVYGADGLDRTYYAADGLAHYTATTEYQYDEGRLTLWWKVHDSSSPVAGRNHTRTESHRLSYSCEGGKVMEEIDHDLDGVADVVIRWLPRADGTVHEYSSSREGPFGNRKLYRFDCE